MSRLGLEHRPDLLERHRRAEEIPLQDLAADRLEERVLLLRLHALRERMEAELLRHIDDCRENHARLRLRLEIAQERHIDLQHIELEILQIVERGIAAAEIIHPELEPLPAQAADLRLEERIALVERALRDLDVQELARHAIGPADGLHLLQHIVELEIDAREIHRDIRDIQPLPADALQILADALQHIEIEPVNEMRILEHGHEHAR